MAAIVPITPSSRGVTLVRTGTAQANTGQTDWIRVPNGAQYMLVFLNVTAVAGTTPVMTPQLFAAEPVVMDDGTIQRLADHANVSSNITGVSQWTIQVGPGVTGVADEVTTATGDALISLNAVLPPIVGISLGLDRADGNETYTYTLAVLFR